MGQWLKASAAFLAPVGPLFALLDGKKDCDINLHDNSDANWICVANNF